MRKRPENFQIILAPEVVKTVTMDKGLLLRLKKTTSCCNVIVEPTIDLISLENIVELQNNDKVLLEKTHGLLIVIEREFLEVYREYTNFEVSLKGILKKKLVINLPPDIIAKEACQHG